MSKDYFPKPEADPGHLPTKKQFKEQVGLPRKPDVEMLVEKAMGAYYEQPQTSDNDSVGEFGDPLLFKIAAKSLQQPIWAFFGNAALAAAPGLLVLLAVNWRGIISDVPVQYVIGAPLIVLAGILVFIMATRLNVIAAPSMGALAGGILVASIFAVHIITHERRSVDASKSPTPRASGDRSQRTIEGIELKSTFINFDETGRSVLLKVASMSSDSDPHYSISRDTLIRSNADRHSEFRQLEVNLQTTGTNDGLALKTHEVRFASSLE